MFWVHIALQNKVIILKSLTKVCFRPLIIVWSFYFVWLRCMLIWNAFKYTCNSVLMYIKLNLDFFKPSGLAVDLWVNMLLLLKYLVMNENNFSMPNVFCAFIIIRITKVTDLSNTVNYPCFDWQIKTANEWSINHNIMISNFFKSSIKTYMITYTRHMLFVQGIP